MKISEWKRRDRADGDPVWECDVLDEDGEEYTLIVEVECSWHYEWSVYGGWSRGELARGSLAVGPNEEDEDWDYQRVGDAQALCESVAHAVLGLSEVPRRSDKMAVAISSLIESIHAHKLSSEDVAEKLSQLLRDWSKLPGIYAPAVLQGLVEAEARGRRSAMAKLDEARDYAESAYAHDLACREMAETYERSGDTGADGLGGLLEYATTPPVRPPWMSEEPT